MKKEMNGKRYYFEITSELAENKCAFFIKVKYKSSNRYSYINNLNCILSEFSINIDNPLVSESQWHLAKEKSKLFMKKANNFLSDEKFVEYIEKQLDLDRASGEWENVEDK